MKLLKDPTYRRDLAEDAVVAAIIALLVCGVAGILVILVFPTVEGLAAWVNATAVVFWVVFLLQRWGSGPRTPVDR